VFLTSDGDIKILDFGIARIMPGAGDDEFDAGRIAALTPAYASCEMFERKPPHPADDVYALGVMAYELFTGSHPYPQALSSKHPALTAREEGMKVARPVGFNRRQWQAVSQSLSLERSERPQDGAEFLRRFSPRSPVPLALVGVSLLLGVALVWSLWLKPVPSLPEIPFEQLPPTAQAELLEAVDEGWLALRLEDYNGALQLFSAAYDIHPRNPDAQAGLDAIVQAVVGSPAGDDRKSLEARLDQVSVLLSYKSLENRPELLALQDELSTRLTPR
jgi:serine/threonine protein kinase